MRTVYRLSDEMKRKPELTERAQSLTLDRSRPLLGLKGSHGLYGSPEWWENIRSGVIPQTRRSGVIQRLFSAGIEQGGPPTSFEMLCDDDTTWKESMYFNSAEGERLFELGKTVEIIYITDELKALTHDGQKQFLDIVLEMSLGEAH